MASIMISCRLPESVFQELTKDAEEKNLVVSDYHRQILSSRMLTNQGPRLM